MSISTFIQASASAAYGAAITTFIKAFTSPISNGSAVLIAFRFTATGAVGFTVTDTLGNDYTHNFIVGNNIAIFLAGPSGPGANTITVVQTVGGTTLSNVAAAVAEYSNPVLLAGSNAAFTPGFGLNNPASAIDVAMGGGVNGSIVSGNELWQPLTGYPNLHSAFFSIVDNNVPAHIQSVFIHGTSGAVQPVWNEGGQTNDAPPLVWQDTTVLAPPGDIPIFVVGSAPWSEFPAVNLGWTVRASANNVGAGGIAIYDKLAENFVPTNLTSAATKSVDTYDMNLLMFNIAAFPSSVPPSGPSTGILRLNPDGLPFVPLPFCVLGGKGCKYF